MFLSFRTNRSGQTVQTQIRLLLRSSLIRVYLVCHSVYMFWMHYCTVHCSNFRITTTIFQVSEYLGILRYISVWTVLQYKISLLTLESFVSLVTRYFQLGQKIICVFQVSALKKLGMVCWHNILFYRNISNRNFTFHYIFFYFSANVTIFCSQFTIKCLGSQQKPR